ncbi:TAP transporter inhibitor ICP47 [Human alphaherpesvirus 1]|uniref:ICP47 protein n=2 Tax=Human herpesvirus 1 TaxID=10298 RepID=A0A0B5EDP3_HHV1|nr:TAP transporter inhibitor ICP47 [Human alphaherpesvirus 1]AJE60229.1 US12 [Human alphaherpesvirus 1]AJE60300.1 US12 [Human alphaherpesvirus 1]UAW21743.1 ICP47 [synthetic construct]WNN26857.1 ICP47 [synthetic construct]
MSWALEMADTFLDNMRVGPRTYADVRDEINKRGREDREAAKTAVHDPERPLLRSPGLLPKIAPNASLGVAHRRTGGTVTDSPRNPVTR